MDRSRFLFSTASYNRHACNFRSECMNAWDAHLWSFKIPSCFRSAFFSQLQFLLQFPCTLYWSFVNAVLRYVEHFWQTEVALDGTKSRPWHFSDWLQVAAITHSYLFHCNDDNLASEKTLPLLPWFLGQVSLGTLEEMPAKIEGQLQKNNCWKRLEDLMGKNLNLKETWYASKFIRSRRFRF